MSNALRKKFFAFIVVGGIVTILLLLMQFVDQPLKEYISSVFASMTKMVEDHDGHMVESNPAAGIALTLIKIVKIILWMTLVITIVRFINTLIFSAAFRNAGASEISILLRNVVSIIIYVIAFATIVKSYFNTDLTTLFAGSTIVGVVLGLALQDTLGNLFSGIALQADQPFQIGDVISLGGHHGHSVANGVVESVSWRGVKIRTFQNKLLIISNASLGKELIEVAPRDNLNARLVNFNTLYSHSPSRTIQTVRETVRHVENVSPKKRPIIRIRNLGDSGLEWEVKYWLEDYSKYNDTDALIRQRIWYLFQREKIEFAYPTRTLHIENKQQDEAFEETPNEIFERLSNVPLFAPLSDEETHKLADSCLVRVFAPGEAVVRKGQQGNSMFVVHRGSVKIQIMENSSPKTVATLAEGDIFGEMGLFTGEPRRADVIAAEEIEVLEIHHHNVKPLFEENPNLAQALSKTIADRGALLAEKEAENDAVVDTETKGVFDSIKRFFGLD